MGVPGHRLCLPRLLHRLDFCSLSQPCYLMISQVIHKSTSLKILGMAGNKVTDWGLKLLCDALRPSWCTLRRLT